MWPGVGTSHDRAVTEDVVSAAGELDVAGPDLVEVHADVRRRSVVLRHVPLVGLQQGSGVGERTVAAAMVEVEMAVDDVGDLDRVVS